MMTIKTIFMVLMVGGFIGSLYRGCDRNNWIGFWHNAIKFILFVWIVANHAFF